MATHFNVLSHLSAMLHRLTSR